MQCNFDPDSVGALISGVISITQGSEYHLQSALATAGPISIAVDASTNSFRVRSDTHYSLLSLLMCVSHSYHTVL